MTTFPIGPVLRFPSATTWVYFIQAGPEGPIKIGISEDPHQRLKTMQPSNPEPLALIGAYPMRPPDEPVLHHRFKQHRIRGEWFTPAQEIIDWARHYSAEYEAARSAA